MSNEYKDWLWDTAQEYILEKEYMRSIEHFTIWEDGYLALGTNMYGDKVMFFIWFDDIDGWGCKLIEI